MVESSQTFQVLSQGILADKTFKSTACTTLISSEKFGIILALMTFSSIWKSKKYSDVLINLTHPGANFPLLRAHFILREKLLHQHAIAYYALHDSETALLYDFKWTDALQEFWRMLTVNVKSTHTGLCLVKLQLTGNDVSMMGLQMVWRKVCASWC